MQISGRLQLAWYAYLCPYGLGFHFSPPFLFFFFFLIVLSIYSPQGVDYIVCSFARLPVRMFRALNVHSFVDDESVTCFCNQV